MTRLSVWGLAMLGLAPARAVHGRAPRRTPMEKRPAPALRRKSRTLTPAPAALAAGPLGLKAASRRTAGAITNDCSGGRQAAPKS